MEEQIYQDVWRQVFGQMWIRTVQDADGNADEDLAGAVADAAAAAAVRKWDESKRLAAITAKNQENP